MKKSNENGDMEATSGTLVFKPIPDVADVLILTHKSQPGRFIMERSRDKLELFENLR